MGVFNDPLETAKNFIKSNIIHNRSILKLTLKIDMVRNIAQ